MPIITKRGDMNRERAVLTEDKQEKERLSNLALDYWFKATHVINIDPSTREEIQKQIDRLKTEMRTQGMQAPEDPADPSATPASTLPTELPKEPVSGKLPSVTPAAANSEASPASQSSPTEPAPAPSAEPPSTTSPSANADEKQASPKEPSS